MISRLKTRQSDFVAATLAVTLTLLQAGCSTTYQPRRSDQVGVVIHHAGAMYVKDGRELPIGPFNGDLEGLVAETPEAAAHARKGHTQFMFGVPGYLLGAAGVVVGVAALSGPVGWVVIGAGAATAGTGLSLMGAGLTHAVDAVNIHNDAVSQRSPAQIPGPRPPPAP